MHLSEETEYSLRNLNGLEDSFILTRTHNTNILFSISIQEPVAISKMINALTIIKLGSFILTQCLADHPLLYNSSRGFLMPEEQEQEPRCQKPAYRQLEAGTWGGR
jgi:hypothetical protein